jgi:hypothetical protein
MDWQRDYWFGLILILPPEKIRTSIDALRHQFDPESAATCPAHISLSDPLSGEMTQEHTREIRHILSSIDPFTLHFEKPHASPERAGVSYPITPQEPIDALKDALHTVSVFNDQPYGRRGIPAHMTIAEFITIEESQSICEELQLTAPSGSFLCDRLSFIVPDDNFHF